jgi:hypothetical protein
MTLLDSALYAKEEPEEELVGAGPALTDQEAKRPGKAANVRERAVPKPPLSKGRKPKAK